MAGKIDFNALRARTMGSGNDEEAVTVDTRGLISKVLSRYSGKWTVLREMIQNAADASATRVTIKFETLPSTTMPLPPSTDATALIKHVISHHCLKRLLISNNGDPFSEKDWSRLKRIADGNPDETKIGAFGVGFYSVFDDCEEPFVSSGGQAMAFYWKGNALFTRRLRLEKTDSSPDTTFVLDYRNNSSPVPSLMQLCQFLAGSLTFVGLETIELWLDEWNLLKLTKKIAQGVNVDLPKDIETQTLEGLMKVQGVTREIAQVDAAWMEAVEWSPLANLSSRSEGPRDATGSLRTFFSRFTTSSSHNLEKSKKAERVEKPDEKNDLTKISTTSVFLHINTASIQVSITGSLSDELERATRKPPPKRTTLAILMPSYEAGMPSAKSEVLASVLPSKSGRIFIGFPTQQTTGLNAHISAPSVIPTVERENIDLNTRYISKWNHEMLRAAGIVCRIAWSAEMAFIKSRILSGLGGQHHNTKIRKPNVLGSVPEAIHTANQFVFRESTPSQQLGHTIENSFWTCNKNASIEILSTCGVLPSHQVRIAPKDLSFMDGSPVLLEDFVVKSSDFVKRLTDFGLVTEVTVSDIKMELEASALSSTQLQEFLKWLARKATTNELDRPTVKALLNVAVAHDESANNSPGRLLVMAEIDAYLNSGRIPADLPLPHSVMPFKYTKALNKREMDALGWSELQVVPWLGWLIENASNRSILPGDKDMTKTAPFATQILLVMSKQWDSLNHASRQTVVDALSSQSVIPTNGGMKLPGEAYFPSVRLFDDLPIIATPNGLKEKFLVALGVRKTVELGVIFDRLLVDTKTVDNSKGGDLKGKWSHVDLIKYLASVKDDIPISDIDRLKNAIIWTAEIEDSKAENQVRYKISDLFEPKEALRKLGLPVIQWPGTYRSNNIEGKFLSMLGLRSHPLANEVIQIIAKAASKGNLELQTKAMSYLITEHHSNGYSSFDSSSVTIPYLPVERSGILSTPSNCFTHEGASLLGFSVLRKDLHHHAQKFGVKDHPPVRECVNILIRKPPGSSKEARILFSYMAKRIGDLGRTEKDFLSQAPIVPVSRRSRTEKGLAIYHVKPRLCYLGASEDYGEIFDFVDFGEEANLFLLAIGSQREPTKIEIAHLMVKEPAMILGKLQSPDKYLDLLRSLAEVMSTLSKNRDLFSEMKKAPFLLSSKEFPSQKSTNTSTSTTKSGEDEDFFGDEDPGIKEWHLTTAKDTVIVDDYQSFTLFKEHIQAAPQEESLEVFYAALGSPFLSTIIEERPNLGSIMPDQQPAEKIRKLIKERTRLFFHDRPPESIKHDTKWLDKNLSVKVAHSISLKRDLKNRRASHTQRRKAIITQTYNDWTLWICPGKYDLYEISQALVHLILVRPQLHSIITLEMLLKTDLLELKARGYNVERILRQRAAEASRIAEDKRQKLEEDQRRLQEREAEWSKTQEQQAAHRNIRTPMPGLFPNSLPSAELQPQEPNIDSELRPHSLFSNITKRFGLEDGGKMNNRFHSLFNGQPPTEIDSSEKNGAPPPYSIDDPQKPKPNEPRAVTSPYALQRNLLTAIQSCRSHGASDVYNRPITNQVAETKSYCDERPGHDLEFTATLPLGMRFFTTRIVSDKSTFLAENSAGINSFSILLMECASVFSMQVDSLSIFYDPAGRTIAFNRGGSIFCNYLYFNQLHQTKLLQDPSVGRSDALIYWWVILCHELAHNLVETHSSDHSYYTEGFVAQYFPRIAEKLTKSNSS